MTDIVTIYLIAENEESAVHISTALVREKLIACSNVQGHTRSIYEENGLIALENEVTVFMKTSADMAEKAVARIKELHSYHTPCINILPVLGGNQDYIDWVLEKVK